MKIVGFELWIFDVLTYRPNVERTIGWRNRCRRLSGDHKHDRGSSEAMDHLAMTILG
jgi:transposase